MRIWLVSQSYLPYYGGITEHVWHLAAELAARGHRVTILTGQPALDGRCPPEADPPGVTVLRVGRTVRLPSNGTRACVTLGWRWSRARAARRAAPPDIVHLQSPLEPFLPLWALRHLPGIKIGTFHTGGSRPHWGYRYFAPCLRAPARELAVRLAVSPEAAHYVGRHLPGDYRIVPNGVALDRFDPTPPPTGRPGRILYVGRLDPRKGLPTLLAAFAALLRTRAAPDPQLWLAGAGPLGDRLLRQVRHRALPVRLLGTVGREQLPQLYREADVCVAPSVDGESFGIALLEALAAGRPLVAADLPGYRSTVAASGAVLFHAPGSVTELRAALAALLDDPARRAQMGRAGRRFAARYDWPGIAERIERIYVESRTGERGGRIIPQPAAALSG